MTYDTPIDEPIKVWAFFDPSTNVMQPHLYPIAFSWRRRLIRLEKVIFTATRTIGHTKLVSIVCKGEEANWELEYNAQNYVWKLKRVMDE